MPYPISRPNRLLILGGTAEAAALARATLERFGDQISVTTALAGRTDEPAPLPGMVRIGGFGGPEGLASYLESEAVDLLIDATHPFAEQISRHARLATEQKSVPRLMLDRPAWKRHPLDRWIEVETMTGAAMAVARLGRRCLMTAGTRGIEAFSGNSGVHFVVRLIDAPREALPLPSYELLLARGPFVLADERALLKQHRIDIMVAKASGGGATEAKLIAAREAEMPVVLLRRPRPEPGPRVENVAAALEWIGARLGGSTTERGKEALLP
jgi:precorrin-6A/cobalt-precorrin-6A reductase